MFTVGVCMPLMFAVGVAVDGFVGEPVRGGAITKQLCVSDCFRRQRPTTVHWRL